MHLWQISNFVFICCFFFFARLAFKSSFAKMQSINDIITFCLAYITPNVNISFWFFSVSAGWRGRNVLKLFYWIFHLHHKSHTLHRKVIRNLWALCAVNISSILKKLVISPQGMDIDAFEKKFNTLEVDFIRNQQLFCQDVLKLRLGQRAVICNGRVSGLHLHNYCLKEALIWVWWV